MSNKQAKSNNVMRAPQNRLPKRLEQRVNFQSALGLLGDQSGYSIDVIIKATETMLRRFKDQARREEKEWDYKIAKQEWINGKKICMGLRLWEQEEPKALMLMTPSKRQKEKR